MKTLYLLSLLIIAVDISAQDSNAPKAKDGNVDTKPFKEVTVNFNTAALQSYLPFDEQFLLVGEVPNDVISTKCKLSVKKLDGTLITEKTYDAKLVTPDGATKSSISFIVDPIPPNIKVTVEFTFKKKVASLAGYNKIARDEIDQTLRMLAKSGVSLPSDFGRLQQRLKDKLGSNFPTYTVDWERTFLKGNWNTDYPGELNDLFDNYSDFTIAINRLSDAIAQRQLIPSATVIKTSARIRSLYSFFKNEKNERAQFVLGKIIGSVDSDWIWVYLGQSFIESNSPGPIEQYSIAPPSPLMSVSEATTAKANIKKTMESLSFLAYIIETEVVGNATAMRKIKGSNLIRGELNIMNVEFGRVADALRDMSDILRIPEEYYNDVVGTQNKCNEILDAIIKSFTFTIEGKDILQTTTDEDFEVRGGWYISADAGVALLPKIHTAQPYYGANIYFTPVNKNAVYTVAQLKKTYNLNTGKARGMWLLKRMSLSVGIMPNSIADSQKRINNLWGNNNLMVGGGIRLGRAFRITYGALVFQGYKNGDLLTTRKELKATSYVSASVDVDLLKFFGKVGELIFK